MSYSPTSDFLALLRQTSGGIRSERMPGLDYIVAAFARAGLITVVNGQTPPTPGQPNIVWFRPALPTWTAEGSVFLWNAATETYEPATPLLWSDLIAGPFIDLVPGPAVDAPVMDGIAAIGSSELYAREDHVHPSDTSRAPIASPAFTGAPTAPTQALGDQTTKLATTQFVIANGGLPPPIGSVLPYAGVAAPNVNWQICAGQAVSRTGATAGLFAVLGVTYGAGDGVTTFNVPDLRGRVVAGVDGGANRLTTATMTSQALGGTGGAETVALSTANLPAYTPAGAVTVTNNSTGDTREGWANTVTSGSLGFGGGSSGASIAAVAITASFTGTPQGGTSAPATNVQPTIELNYIIRVS